MLERTANYKINNTNFRVNYADIAQLSVDIIVSSDDNYLSMTGGVSAAIREKGGESIVVEALKHVPVKIGDVAVTSAGNLQAKYIFHAVTIDYTNMIFASEDTIQSATLKCMRLADTLGAKTIAFPALGTGVANFPFQLAAEIMTRTVAEYLAGETRIELVTISLMAREGIRERDINIFYERAVSLASIAIQSKHLNSLLDELARIVNQMDKPLLAKRVTDLQTELLGAGRILEYSPQNIEGLEEIQEKSGITEISNQAVIVSSEVQETTVWADRQLEAEVLRTKLNGLLTQLNIKTSHLNRFEIEKAKYGGQLVPPRLEIAIEEIGQEIAEIEAKTQEVRRQLAQLKSNSN